MANQQPYRIKTISQYHHILDLPKPEHPLISVIDLASFKQATISEPLSLIYDFYCISMKGTSILSKSMVNSNMTLTKGSCRS